MLELVIRFDQVIKKSLVSPCIYPLSVGANLNPPDELMGLAKHYLSVGFGVA